MNEIEQITRDFYCLMDSRDVTGVIRLLSDEITWTVPGPAIVPYAGAYQGKAGVAEFFSKLYAHEDLLSFSPTEFIVDGSNGVVCVLGCETAAALTTGKRFDANWVEVFRVNNQKITAFEEHIDTFKLAEAYTPRSFTRGRTEHKD